MKTYDVLRQHLGDKMYMPGETREASPGDIQHLLDGGVLKETEAAKSEPAPKNKAIKASPKNKAS